MSDLNINMAPAADALALSADRPQGVATAGELIRKPGTEAPDGGDNPFSGLLLGFLQASQPLPAALAAANLAATDPATDGTSEPALVPGLAPGLPATAAALPPGLPVTGNAGPPAAAQNGSSVDPGGKGLPADGRLLPLLTDAWAAPAGPDPAPPADATAADPAAIRPQLATPAAPPSRPEQIATRISLADLDLARALAPDAAPQPSAANGAAGFASDASDDHGPALPGTGVGTASPDLKLTQTEGMDFSRLLAGGPLPGAPDAALAGFTQAANGSNQISTGAIGDWLRTTNASDADSSVSLDSGGNGSSRTDGGLSPALRPLSDPGAWSAGLGDRLLTMTGEGIQSARLRLHPEHLGPLDVRIRVEDGAAQVWFSASHAQTREALETALPKLREMFSDQGIQLLQAQVGSGEPHQGSGSGAASGQPQPGDGWTRQLDASGGATTRTRGLLSSILAPLRAPNRLLDVYA